MAGACGGGETMAGFELAPITVLMGHAGVGKTNVALGLALGEAGQGREVTLADLDVVNPYFRSSDYPELLRKAGIRLIAPVLARTTLDTPSLTGELDAVIAEVAANPKKRLIIDVGGDDDGATTIGRWSAMLRNAGTGALCSVGVPRAYDPGRRGGGHASRYRGARASQGRRYSKYVELG